jgi:hypothetical protein
MKRPGFDAHLSTDKNKTTPTSWDGYSPQGGLVQSSSAVAGTHAEHGLVIGVRPHDTAENTCPDPSTVIVTNLGQAHNAITAWSADTVIILGGWRILAHHGSPLPDPTTPAANVG